MPVLDFYALNVAGVVRKTEPWSNQLPLFAVEIHFANPRQIPTENANDKRERKVK